MSVMIQIWQEIAGSGVSNRFGLLINFHEDRVVDGISRIVNGGGNG